jgi:hypothetical protein
MNMDKGDAEHAYGQQDRQGCAEGAFGTTTPLAAGFRSCRM